MMWRGGQPRDADVDGWMDWEMRACSVCVDVGKWRVRGGRGPVDHCT
jgi:hypothetical protein